MALLLLLGIALSWTVHSARVQRDAVSAIESAGGGVLYDWDRGDGRAERGMPLRCPQWVVAQLGIDYFSKVVAVWIHTGRSDANLALVGRLPRLEKVYFDRHVGADEPDFADGLMVTDRGLVHLAGLTRLERLDL
jgi:hypothetical protein